MATGQRLIDANSIPYHPSGFPKGDGFDSCLDWAFRGDIDKLPTVDAVEVVRCRDCRWYNSELGICNLHSESKGEPNVGYVVGMDPDDFCSYGERRS